ncbi:MAG: hypothetical protein J7L28_02625 [Thermotogae bacterium]|nr:hypothetical protein [Thermotogota bacterium]
MKKLRVELVGVSPVQNYRIYHLGGVNPSSTSTSGAVMSKDEMERLMNLVIYDQFAMAEKLARIVSQMYAGMRFDFLA